MKNMTVRARLAWTFAALTLFVLLVAGMAIKTLDAANQRFTDYVNGANVRANEVQMVRGAVDLRAIASRDLTIVRGAEEIAKVKAVVDKAQAAVQHHLERLKAQGNQPGVSEQTRQMIAEIDKIERAYAPVTQAIVAAAVEGDPDTATTKVLLECRPMLEAMIKATDAYAEAAAKESAGLIAQSDAQYRAQQVVLLAVCALAIAAAIAGGTLITRSLTRALGAEPAELSEVVNRVANGDLSTAIPAANRHPASVMATLGRMQAALIQLVASVRQGSEAVAKASAEIASGNQDLSSRTERQASALEETAASMEELGSTVHQNADSARQANQLAQSASTVAVQGGEVVAQVVDTMKGINDSSRKIADIISVIDGIAFQTNILALNAAVEAARAGEQGRGFAVVASEVRSLAGRSATAAKEIKELINDSVGRVEAGTALVDKAGTTMEEVVASIRRVTAIVGEISAASGEQRDGITQISEAVSSMDQTTQQNAALVEQMAAATASLRGQAQALVQAVAVFKLNASEPSLHPVTVVATRPPVQAPSKPQALASQHATPPKLKQPPQARLPKAAPAAPKADADGEWGTF